MNDRDRLTQDIHIEIADHLERRARDLRAAGMCEADARDQARAEFGDLSAATRDLLTIDARIAKRGRSKLLTGFWQDVRHAVRRNARQPSTSMLMIVTLAVGLGVATAVFTVVDQRILRDPPFLHGDRLVDVIHLSAPNGGGGNNLFPQKILGWQGQPALFERFEAYAPMELELQGEGEPERVMTLVGSVGLFDMLGIQPRIGRGFAAGDGLPGGDGVAVLGHAFWVSRFGADPSVLGERLVLNEKTYTVVGVLSPGVSLMKAEQPLWIPMDVGAWGTLDPRLGFFGVGRLNPGVPVADAQGIADEIAGRLQEQLPLERSWYLGINPMPIADLYPAAHTVLLVLLAAVAVLLLMACVNVTNLLAGQALTRRADVALQSALGASRWRIVRQVLVEGLLLAATAATAALFVAHGVLDVLLALAPEQFSYRVTAPIAIDLRVLAAGGIAAMSAGLFVAMWPAWRATSLAGSASAPMSARGSARGRSFSGAAGALVVIEVALAMLLMTGAALMARTLLNLHAVDPRFDVDRLVTMHVPLPADRYPTELTRRAFFEELDAALQRQPGIERSAHAWGLPPEAGGFSIGAPETEAGVSSGEMHVPINRVSASFFETTGIPILEGRAFRPDDTLEQIIVSESLARRLWPAGSPLERRFRAHDSAAWKTVVGVARDVTTFLGDERTSVMVYEPFDATPPAPRPLSTAAPRNGPVERSYALRTLIVRAADPAAAVPLIRERILAIDPKQTVETITLATDAYAKPFAEQRFLMRVMGAFALCALLMAAAGIIGVLLQAVAYRRREIGIRVALGAGPASVIRLIVGSAGVLAAVGAALGAVASMAGATYLESLLFGVTPYDVVSLSLVAVLVAVTATVACWWPTRRALAVQPAEVLRSE